MIDLRIKDIAKEKKITLNDLARSVGITQPSISRMVNGKIMPSWDTLDKIAATLNVEVYELFSNAPRKADGSEKHTCPHCHEPINIDIT